MSKQHSNQPIIRAGVIGVGSLGQHHARVYTQIPGVVLVGVVDSNIQRAKEVAKKCRSQAHDDYHQLLNQVDVVSVVVPTAGHYAVAKEFIQHGVSVLLEKPMTRTLAEADELIRLAQIKGVKLQVGHIERFNQAIQEMRRMIDAPRFIEVHRLGPYSQRNTDIGVTLDLMIHDLDIILDLVGSPVLKVEAVGVKILSEHEDIANARLTMVNGCVANVSASRVSIEAKRKIRIFTQTCYVSLDYQKQELVIYRLKKDAPLGEDKNLMQLINRERKVFGTQEPLMAELQSFVEAVRTGQEPEVTGFQGRQALAVALEISEQIREQNLAG